MHTTHNLFSATSSKHALKDERKKYLKMSIPWTSWHDHFTPGILDITPPLVANDMPLPDCRNPHPPTALVQSLPASSSIDNSDCRKQNKTCIKQLFRHHNHQNPGSFPERPLQTGHSLSPSSTLGILGITWHSNFCHTCSP